MIAFLEQVQSIDYSGDEVQVTTTSGAVCTAQKVSAVRALRAARGLFKCVALLFAQQSLVAEAIAFSFIICQEQLRRYSSSEY